MSPGCKDLTNLTEQPIDTGFHHLFSFPCPEGCLGMLDPTELGTLYRSLPSLTSTTS